MDFCLKVWFGLGSVGMKLSFASMKVSFASMKGGGCEPHEFFKVVGSVCECAKLSPLPQSGRR